MITLLLYAVDLIAYWCAAARAFKVRSVALNGWKSLQIQGASIEDGLLG
jgi:hypothetical protein